MRELGYDLTRHHSKSMADLPAVEFDAVVTMGCGERCPAIHARRRKDWDIPDPKNLRPEEVRRVRDLIAGEVKVLLEIL